MIKLIQFIIRMPFSIVLLLGVPLMWLISFSIDGIGDANEFVKEYAIEIISYKF